MVKPIKEEDCALGVDLGGNNLRWGLVSAKGEILRRDAVRSKILKDKEKTIEHILDSIKKAVSKYQQEGFKIKGVGVGVPGLVMKETGCVYEAPNFSELNGLPLQKLLEQSLSLPVLIENDVNAWAWGERSFGAGKKYKNFIVMTLGTGVGGGIVINGNLIDGKDGTAGEVGHITIYPDGLECKCGNIGCLERYASATGIIDNLALQVKNGDKIAIKLVKDIGKELQHISSYDIYNEAKKGDKLAAKLFKDAGTALGIAIAGLINLLNFEAIIIGGGVSAAWDVLLPTIKKEVKKRAFLMPARRCKIIKAALGDNGGILGMAKMIFEQR